MDCQACAFRQRCATDMPVRKVARSIHGGTLDIARNSAGTEAYLVSTRQRKRDEVLFVLLRRILNVDHLGLRGPIAARDEFYLADARTNLRKFAKMRTGPGLAMGLSVIAGIFTCYPRRSSSDANSDFATE